MACWKCSIQKQEDYSWIRDMAKKTAVLTDVPQVVYKEGDLFKFCPFEGFEGGVIEIISNI